MMTFTPSIWYKMGATQIDKGPEAFIVTGGYIYRIKHDPKIVRSYEELQAMGGFTDQEITLIRLKFGHLPSFRNDGSMVNPIVSIP